MRSLVLLISLLLVLASCSANLFSELGSKKTDDALLYEAQKAVNEQRYDDAVNIITNQLSATIQQTVEAREILASAYGGKCGLNFAEYVEGLSAATSGSIFVLMSSPFVGQAVDPTSCLTALQTLDAIGTNAQRTTSQNAFASVLGMVLMGSATRLYTDDSPVNGDGSQDVVDVSCSLTDPQIDNVILGYAYMAQNFSAVSAQVGGSATTITDSMTVCDALAGAACTNTDPAQITTQIRDTMKDLMNTVEYGVGTADGSNPLLIPVACP